MHENTTPDEQHSIEKMSPAKKLWLDEMMQYLYDNEILKEGER